MPLLDLGTIVWVAIISLAVAGALSPLETLGWWAGWYGDPVDEAEIDPGHGDPEESDGGGEPLGAAATVGPWVVFLSGINAVGAEAIGARESDLLLRLRQEHPGSRVVQVFPYSVTNRALTGERVFAGVWRLALRAKMSRRRLAQAAGFLINARNVWQVLVSADRRYGPFYNRGSAELIVRSLRRRGFAPDDATATAAARIVLIGYSGGSQVAFGAAPFVKERTGAAVTVVSLGGVMSADPGMLDVDAAWHLYGRRDRVQRWSAWAFPGRWRLLPWSPWNVARRRGTLRSLELGPCDHTGKDGYLDAEAFVRDGRSYFDVTTDVLVAIVAGRTESLPVGS